MPQGRLRDPRRQRFRGRDRRLRRRRAAAGQDLDQRADPRGSMSSSSRSAIATRSRPGATDAWSAASTASARRGVLRREHVLARARRLQDRAGPSRRAAARRRLPAARHPVHDRAPEALRRGRRRPPPYHRLLEDAIARPADFTRCRGGQRGMRSCGRLRQPSRTRRVRRSARAGLGAEGPADDGLSPPVSLPDGVPYVRAVTSGSSAHSTLGQLVQAHRTAWKLACGAARPSLLAREDDGQLRFAGGRFFALRADGRRALRDRLARLAAARSPIATLRKRGARGL